MVYPGNRRRPLLVAVLGSLCLLTGFAVPGSAAVAGANSSLGVTIAAYEGDSVGSSSTGIIDAGSDVTYEVTVTSPGKTRQTNVDVSVGLTSNFVFDVASTPSDGTVTSGDGILSWSIPKLPKGASATLDYTETADTPDLGMEADATTVSAGSDQITTSTINFLSRGAPRSQREHRRERRHAIGLARTNGHLHHQPGERRTLRGAQRHRDLHLERWLRARRTPPAL